MTILIVDDVGFNRELVKKSLNTAGYKAIDAESAEEALRCLATRPDISVVLCDLMMPEMDGVDLLQRYQELTVPTGPVPPEFILLSSSLDERRLREALQTGFSTVIKKPIENETLIQTVATCERQWNSCQSDNSPTARTTGHPRYGS